MRKIFLFSTALVCFAAPAFAENAGTQEEQAACRGDVRKFCATIGGSDNQKFQQCLQAHFQQLSQKCQEVLMKHQSPK